MADRTASVDPDGFILYEEPVEDTEDFVLYEEPVEDDESAMATPVATMAPERMPTPVALRQAPRGFNDALGGVTEAPAEDPQAQEEMPQETPRSPTGASVRGEARARRAAARQEQEPAPDPFEGEGLAATAKRRGQQFVQGASEVVASVPEAAAIQGEMSDRSIAADATGYVQAAQARIAEINRRLADRPDMPQESRERLLDERQKAQDTVASYAPISEGSALEQEITPARERPLFKKGDEVRGWTAERFGAPDPRDTTFWAQLAQGGGNMTGFAVSTLAAAALTGPGGGIVAGGLTGSAMTEAALYKEAISAGLSDKEALEVARWGSAIGATEVIPIARALKLLPAPARKRIGDALGKRFSHILHSAGEEAAQEFLAETAQNIVASEYFDPERGWFEGAPQAALIGGILGGFMGAGGTMRGEERLTPEDRSSPIPDRIIAAGKDKLAQIEGQGATDLPSGAVPMSTLYGDGPTGPTGTRGLTTTIGGTFEQESAPSNIGLAPRGLIEPVTEVRDFVKTPAADMPPPAQDAPPTIQEANGPTPAPAQPQVENAVPAQAAEPEVAAQPAPRPVARPKIQKRPFTTLIKGIGIHPEGKIAAELRAQDITPATVPGLFKRTGVMDLDNLPASEWEDWRNVIGEDGQGYLDRQGIIDALVEENAGRPVQVGEQEALQAQADIEEEIARAREAGELDMPAETFEEPESLNLGSLPDPEIDISTPEERRATASDLVRAALTEPEFNGLFSAQEIQEIEQRLVANGGDVENALYWAASREPDRATEDRQYEDSRGSRDNDVPFGDDAGELATGNRQEDLGANERNPSRSGGDRAPQDGSAAQDPAGQRAPERGEAQVEGSADPVAAAIEAARAAGEIEHVTQKGKTLTGYVLNGVSRDQAKDLDKYTFKKDGGYFVRTRNMPAAETQQASPAALDAEATPEGEQTLIPGVAPITDKDRAEVEMAKPKSGGRAEPESQIGGMFDTGQGQESDLFDSPKADAKRLTTNEEGRAAGKAWFEAGNSEAMRDDPAMGNASADARGGWTAGYRRAKADADKNSGPTPSAKSRKIAEVFGGYSPEQNAIRIQENVDEHGWDGLAFHFKVKDGGGRHHFEWFDGTGKLIAKMKRLNSPKAVLDGRLRDALSAYATVSSDAEIRDLLTGDGARSTSVTSAKPPETGSPAGPRVFVNYVGRDGKTDAERGGPLPPDGSTGGKKDSPGPAEPAAQPKKSQESQKSQGASYGAKNTLVTQDRRAELAKRLREKLSTQLNAGIDPEILAMGAELTVFHIEAGARKFADAIAAVARDLGTTPDRLARFARGWYNGARDMMEDSGLSIDGMDDADTVRAELENLRNAPIVPPSAASGGLDVDALVEGFVEAFQDLESFKTIVEARSYAEEILGRKLDGGEYKALEEAIEIAVVKSAQARAKRPDAFTQLVELYGQQPKLAQRTSSSLEAQAYSTPAPLAYLASRLAGINSASRVFEPTAGNGMLLLDANPANVTAVELQEDRVDGLRRTLGDEATIIEGDAMTVALPDYDTVIANPPFGKIKGDDRKSVTFALADVGGTTTEIDHAIMMRALSGLPENGRAVFIIGGQKGDTQEQRRKGYTTDKNRKFFKKLYDNFNVTEHFTADGSLYQKQGAAWPVDIIVIDGKRKSALPYPMKEAPALYREWSQLGDRLNGTLDSLDTRELDAGDRNGGDAATDQDADAGTVSGIPGRPDQPNGQADRPAGSRGPVQSDGGSRGAAQDQRPASEGGRNPGVGERDTGRPDGLDGTDGAPADQSGPGTDPRAGGEADARRVSEDSLRRDRIERNNEEAETDFQIQYEPTSNAQFAVGTLVPRNMQGAMSRALADLASRVPNGDIDAFVASELGYGIDEMLGTPTSRGHFSAEQVDAIALAIDNVQKGAGFIIGDQTGVGKGRIVAAMLRYASRQGHIPVFITAKPGLYRDMVRDLRDIGMDDVHTRVFPTNPDLRGEKKALPLSDRPGDVFQSPTPKFHRKGVASLLSGKLPEGYDMVFTTYDQLNSVKGMETARRNAMRQIAPRAMFILDESHEAGGQKQSERFKDDDKAPGRATLIRELLADAPAAMFSSATYAKNPHVMTLYAKTDLSLAVDKMDELTEVVESGGVPMQQIMANMLVEAGQYARRERSYEGVKMELSQLVTDKQVATRGAETVRTLFRLDVDVMQDVRESYINEAGKEGEAGILDNSVGGTGLSSSNFASVMHNLAAQLLLAIKVDAVVDAAIAVQKQGRKPIIAISNTNETILKDAIEAAGISPGESIDIPFNIILDRYLERLRMIGVKDENDNVRHIRLTDGQIVQHGGQEALNAYNEARKAIASADLNALPGSPIDQILNRLRAAGIKTGEITGRSYAIEDGTLARRDATSAAKVRTMSDYNSGALDALVINRSGSTGFSLHATDQAGNDGKTRHMLILQPEANIDTFMQMLGRVHRTGQTQLPEYTIAVSDLAVEKRPAAVLMRKLASLNANTTASKKSAVSIDTVTDFLNQYGDRIVRDYLMENPQLSDDLNLTAPAKGDSLDGFAQKFTGRLSVLPPDRVEQIYDEIEGQYRELIATLDRLGENALEAKVLPLDAVTVDKTEVAAQTSAGSPFGAAAYVETVDIKRLGKPYSSDMLASELDKVLNGRTSDQAARQNADRLRQLLPAALESIEAGRASAEKRAAEAKTDKQKQSAADAVRRWGVKLDALKQRMDEIIAKTDEFAPGRTGILQSNGNPFYAMVLDFDISRVEKNPTAASSISVRVAIADAGREIRVPLSKLLRDSDATYSWSPSEQRNTVLRAFDAGQSESRERRQMVTGNIVAGYAKFKKGLITLYTDDTGQIRRGVLLPKSLDAGATLRKRPAKFADPRHITEFLTAGGWNERLVTTEDDILGVSYNGQFNLVIKTKGAKRYILNKAVREIVGDFEQRAGAKIYRKYIRSAADVEKILTIYAENLGTEYSTNSHKDEARAITGEEVPDIAAIDGQEEAKFQQPGQTPAADSTRIDAAMGDLRKRLDQMGLKGVHLERDPSMEAQAAFEADAGGAMRILIGAAADPEASVRHEVIHALKASNLFTKAEWAALEQRARSLWMTQHKIKSRYPDLSEAAQIEEAIAEGFANWKPNAPASPVKSAFAKVKRFFRAMRDWMQGQGIQNADDLFGAIESGDVGSRESGPITEARKEQRQAARDQAMSKEIGERIEFAVDPQTLPEERQTSFLKAAATQPLDSAFKLLFMPFGGIDKNGKFRLGVAGEKWLTDKITNAEIPETSLLSFMNPAIKRARIGLIDRHGLPESYVELERHRGIDQSEIMAEGLEFVREMQKADMSPQESQVLQAILTGEAVDDAQFGSLPGAIRKSLDEMGQEAVRLGLLSPESYERNRGTYLHRVYEGHETQVGPIGRMTGAMARGRRVKIAGDQFKGRGIFEEVDAASIWKGNEEYLGARRGTPQKGDRVIILDKMSDANQGKLAGVTPGKPRRDRRVYWPADRAIPAKFSSYENRGTFEVRGEPGKKITLWRDFTKQERTRMGEILDARYTVAKTYHMMAQDLATGKFFKALSENEDWVKSRPPEGAVVAGQDKKMSRTDPDVEWVRVPETKIGQSDTLVYGAIAGKYIRADIWRDMEELKRMQTPGWWRPILTQWKLNKTARNPVVHMNNIMSNFMLMDMANVRMSDLAAAAMEIKDGGEFYEEAKTNGAFGADMVAQEIRRDVLEPILKELRDEIRNGKGGLESETGRLGLAPVGWVADRAVRLVTSVDRAMTSAYQMEDEVFRMATYIRRRKEGMSATDAAIEARDQFLNYDIRAPWVNAARNSVVPFISYTYRAMPVLFRTLMERPWKMAKYATVAYMLNELGYLLAPTDDDEEGERGSLRDEEQGTTWVRTPRLIRMPWLSGENPVYLDTRRWIPGGDIFETGQNQALPMVPNWLQVGGPIVLGAEVWLNRSAFTGEDIVNEVTDTTGEKIGKQAGHLYRSWMPSAPWIPGGWYWNKIGRALNDEARTYTGDPYKLSDALLSSVGIKVQPKDVDFGYEMHGFRFDKVERELSMQMRSLQRQRARGLIGREAYDRASERLKEKLRRLNEARQDVFSKRR